MMATNQQSSSPPRTTVVYERISEHSTMTILDDQMKNCMEVLIAEYIGEICKNYSLELQRLSAYAFYPPMNPTQIRTMAIENITSTEVKRQISEKIYKRLEIIFENKINHWNSVLQTTAKRFLANNVQEAVDTIREKLLTTHFIVQRFVLTNNLLKLV